MAKRSTFVGMDAHKESIDVTLAEDGRDGEVRHFGIISGDLEGVAKLVRALRAPNRRPRFVAFLGHRAVHVLRHDAESRTMPSDPGCESTVAENCV
jgi:hypothetical protein